MLVDRWKFLIKTKITTTIRCSYQVVKKLSEHFVCSLIMLRFREKKVTKESFYAAKNPLKNWYVNVDNIIISRLIETKTNSKYLIGYLDKAI